MGDAEFSNHYEVLQVSPRVDQDTLQRVFRHLAKRFHPDNADSGDPVRFKQLMESFQVLSDPERRARYDVQYAERLEQTWRIYDQSTALDDVAADRRVRTALLSVLYTARRTDSDRPGMGEVELERLLGCPENHLRFHVWYLRENGLIKRTESGALAITATGVDAVLANGGPERPGMRLLQGTGRREDGKTERAL